MVRWTCHSFWLWKFSASVKRTCSWSGSWICWRWSTIFGGLTGNIRIYIYICVYIYIYSLHSVGLYTSYIYIYVFIYIHICIESNFKSQASVNGVLVGPTSGFFWSSQKRMTPMTPAIPGAFYGNLNREEWSTKGFRDTGGSINGATTK